MSHPLRIGAVSYLNTRPLVQGLAESSAEIRLSFDLPSRLADQLKAGSLDVALIPSIEYFRSDDYTIVSSACIGCRGPVMSVKLFSRVPMREIRSLALDEGSRTSAVLAQILLYKKFLLRPELYPLPIGKGISDARTSAVLLIGDRAMHPPRENFTEVWDLGEEWSRWSRLPFVFAMWVAREGADREGIGEILDSARDAGLANLAEIAGREASAAGLSQKDCLAYLRDNLYFHLGPLQQQGLELYYQQAVDLGLAPAGKELRFYDCPTP